MNEMLSKMVKSILSIGYRRLRAESGSGDGMQDFAPFGYGLKVALATGVTGFRGFFNKKFENNILYILIKEFEGIAEKKKIKKLLAKPVTFGLSRRQSGFQPVTNPSPTRKTRHSNKLANRCRWFEIKNLVKLTLSNGKSIVYRYLFKVNSK